MWEGVRRRYASKLHKNLQVTGRSTVFIGVLKPLLHTIFLRSGVKFDENHSAMLNPKKINMIMAYEVHSTNTVAPISLSYGIGCWHAGLFSGIDIRRSISLENLFYE